MTDADRVRAELEVLGVDVTRHVLSFYEDLLAALGVVRSRDLLRCRSGADVLVAGVKTATQTPPVRSGQRVIFVTLDDATGLVDATFFESVQARCAATVFGAWLLVTRGRIRRTGARAVSLRATGCWDLTGLHREWRAGGLPAVRAAMRPDGPDDDGPYGPDGSTTGGRRIVYANGYRLSPYADIAPAGDVPRAAPRKLWHASPGSSGA